MIAIKKSISLRLVYLLLHLMMSSTLCAAPVQANLKGGSLEECMNTNLLCYECDSRSNPNCNDPFTDFGPEVPDINASSKKVDVQNPISTQHHNLMSQDKQMNGFDQNITSWHHQHLQGHLNTTTVRRVPKQYPPVQTCHGCCVKLTSKLGDGTSYVRRTCTTSLVINYFMVGLICMKESGDRGKTCFCETDYCNGQESKIRIHDNHKYTILFIIILSILITRNNYIYIHTF